MRLVGVGLGRDQLGKTLERARRGEVDYLAVCPPAGLPVALGGVDYTLTPGAGTLWQLAVHEALQSCGIGTLLIGAAEQRIRARGLHRAELAVEESDRGPACCMSGSAMPPAAANPKRGMNKPGTGRYGVMRPCAR